MVCVIWYMDEYMKDYELIFADNITVFWNDGMIDTLNGVFYITWDSFTMHREGYEGWSVDLEKDSIHRIWVVGLHEKGSQIHKNLSIFKENCEDILRCLLREIIQYRANMRMREGNKKNQKV